MLLFAHILRQAIRPSFVEEVLERGVALIDSKRDESRHSKHAMMFEKFHCNAW